MSSVVEQGMAAYYNRDPDALRRLLERLASALPVAIAQASPASAGPSSAPSHTGRNEREIAPGSGPGNS